jgi:hypothetical protein
MSQSQQAQSRFATRGRCLHSGCSSQPCSAILHSVRLAILSRHTCSKNRLCFADHIIREYDIDDMILILQARASGEVLRSSIADALWHWRAGVREHLDCRTPIPPDLFEESETHLHSGFVLYLVQENAEYCAVFDGLSAPLSLDCSPTSEPMPIRSQWHAGRKTYKEAWDEQHRQSEEENLCATKISGLWQPISRI